MFVKKVPAIRYDIQWTNDVLEYDVVGAAVSFAISSYQGSPYLTLTADIDVDGNVCFSKISLHDFLK